MEGKKIIGDNGIEYDEQGNPPIIDEHCFWEAEKESTHREFGHSWYWGKTRSGGYQGIPLDLGNDSYVICAAGPRGAGKTSRLTFLGQKCVYLYNSRLISNYPIEWNIRYETHGNHEIVHHEAEKLNMIKLLNFDREYQNCIIIMAEAPQIINRLATMSWKNRLVNLFIQQLRHNRSSLIYDSQNEKWVDGELQWQTDVLEHCRDASRRYPRAGYERGAMILYDVIDKSGLWTGYSYDERPRIIRSGTLLNQAIWGTFGTYHLHDVFESLRGAHMNLDKYEIGKGEEVREGDRDFVPEERRSLFRTAVNTVSAFYKHEKARIKDIYKAMGDLSQKEKTLIGTALQDAGAVITGHGGNKYDLTNLDMAAFMMKLRVA